MDLLEIASTWAYLCGLIERSAATWNLVNKMRPSFLIPPGGLGARAISQVLACGHSSSGGISSSMYRMRETLISVASLPRRMSLTNCVSTCICTWSTKLSVSYAHNYVAFAPDTIVQRAQIGATVPSPKHPSEPRTVCSSTTARPVLGHHQVILQSPPEDFRRI